MAEKDPKNLKTESECQEQENEIKKTDTNQKILEERNSESKFKDQGIQPKKENRVEKIESETKKHEETELSEIKMPPKMLKKKEAKGCRTNRNWIAILKKSKRNNVRPSITPFIKLRGIKKERMILECIVSPSVARNTLKSLLIGAEEIKINIIEIPDLIGDDNYIDFNRISERIGLTRVFKGV